MIKKFLKDTSGNFGAMMAGSLLMLIGAIGLSVDYIGMTDQAAQLQGAVDGAALAAALSGGTNEADVRSASDALFASLKSQGVSVTSEYVFTEGSIIVTAHSTYVPRIMNVLGFGARTISTSAEVPLGSAAGLDIALVLDVTNSMSDGDKLEQMQDAVTGFLNGFQADDIDARVSVVPFSQYVNVGTHNSSQPWIDNSQDGTRFPETLHTIRSRTCPVDRVPATCHGRNDGNLTSFNCTQCPEPLVVETISEEFIEPLKDWDGCVGSRAGSLAVQPDFNGTAFPAVYDDGRDGAAYFNTDYSCPSDAILPLTSNIAAAQTLVGDLDTGGTTYMPSGLAWGWRTLDDDVPFGRPIADENRKKILIMMTDGFNTVSRQGANADRGNDGRYHHGKHNNNENNNLNVTTEANAVTANLCTNIGNAGIETFTIAYEFPNGGNADTGRALLSNCATSGGFFDAANASQLNAAFATIAKSLSDIRLIN